LIRVFIILLLGLTSLIIAQDETASPAVSYENRPTPSFSLLQPTSYITMGSSKEEVFAIQGNPKSIQKLDFIGEEIWTYSDFSTIKFKDGRVHEWNNNGILKVSLYSPNQNVPHQAPQSIINNIQQQIDDFASQKDPQGNLTHPNFKKVSQDMGTLIVFGKAKSLEEAYDKAKNIHAQLAIFAQQKDEDGDLTHPDFEKFRPEIITVMTAGQPKTMEEAYDQAQELHEQINGFAFQIKEAGNLEFPELEKVRQQMGALIIAGYVNTVEDAYERVTSPNKKPSMYYSTPGINTNSYVIEHATAYTTPGSAENGSYYGQISPKTGLPKTIPVEGYYRKNGTFVRGHYRSHR